MTRETNIKLLIEQIKSSNVKAEYKLFELYYSYVKSICLRYSNNEDDADEMLNDSFLRVFKYIDRYDPDYDFKPWLRKVSVNACLDHNKKYFEEKKKVSIDKYNELEGDNDEMLLQNFSGEECMNMLSGLSPQYKIVFNLYVFEEMKHHEIAQELNISVGTSKSNLSRAKEQLREQMKEKRPELFHNKKVLNG
ncbi:MAG: RNA polymerase sigma factor [Saprospiraceae bacterium]